MPRLHLNELLNAVPSQLQQILGKVGDELVITMRMPNQYQAGAKWVLAANWLRTWYIAERLAENASEWKCNFGEGRNGDGEFEFTFRLSDPKGMAKWLVEFGEIFDEENSEAFAFLYDEALGWLEQRKTPSRFPDLEECYRVDEEAAQEEERAEGTEE